MIPRLDQDMRGAEVEVGDIAVYLRTKGPGYMRRRIVKVIDIKRKVKVKELHEQLLIPLPVDSYYVSPNSLCIINEFKRVDTDEVHRHSIHI